MDSNEKKELEQHVLDELLKDAINPVGDKALDNKQKAQGQMEGLRQFLDYISNTSFRAGKATGYADAVEQFADLIRNKKTLIEQKYSRGEINGPFTEAKKSNKIKKEQSKSKKKKKRATGN